MADDARMTVRLDPATRRKVERLAAREGISLNEAPNRLLQRAPDEAEPPARRRRYRLKPRKVGLGFDIAQAKPLAAQTSDEEGAPQGEGAPLKIADVQTLFYAIDPTSDLHEPAARWLEDAINAREPLGLAWPTITQFLRLGTNPAFPGHMTDEEALGWAEEWIEAGVEVVGDADLRWELFSELLEAPRRSLRNAIDDAYLAALAISRATLASFD